MHDVLVSLLVVMAPVYGVVLLSKLVRDVRG